MEPAQIWISEPDRLLHVVASCVVFYIFIIGLTRLSGKRTTGNMNNFDWIITVGIGSIMASGILLRNVSMLDAMVAVSALAGLQWLTTWGTLRSHRFARWVKPRPRMLLRNGHLLGDALRYERITDDEVKSALRKAGLAHCDDAAWVVIETSGELSVIRATGTSGTPEPDLLRPVAGSVQDLRAETDDRGGTRG
ncbi:DUF421 domain-containing protein [Maritimibacter sp. DP1N21-5]|uniref:DUF421 domain-containing protein n=1 Tax=Maritimibacter sp. DP1N21-5 TaxID=2836867 RepID=UPI001C485F13|nr:YetF domain-containing protein [Maritimibacter sp. DP1N21-5]MBV7409515.1 DUF421 domain-containing protein [Maritimibacter sp. DP1N21-5]